MGNNGARLIGMSKPMKFQFVQMAGQYKELCAEYSRVYEDQSIERREFLLAELARRREVLRSTLNRYKRDVSTGLPFVTTAAKTDYPNHKV